MTSPALVRGLIVGLAGLAAAPLAAQSVPAATQPVVVRVAVSGHSRPHASVLHHPERILVEWFGTRLSGPARKFAIDERGVTGVRLWSSRDTVRLVVDLSRPQPFAIAGDDSTTSVYIGVATVPAASVRPAPAAAPAPTASLPAPREVVQHAPAPQAAPVAPTHQAVSRSAVAAAPVQPQYRPVAPLLNAGPAPMIARAGQGLIDVEFSNTDLRDAIQSFADFSGRSIVAGARVQGKVSAKITQKPWRSALTEILSANGFAVEDGADGILRVDEEKAVYERQRYEPLATRIVRVNYVKPTAILPMVTASLSRDCGVPGAVASSGTAVCVVRGSVSAEESTNSISITELPSHMDAVVAFVHSLDFRTQQVKIRAKLIFVDRSRLDELGLAYDVGTSSQYSNKLVPRADPAGGSTPVDRNGDGVPDGSVPKSYQSPNTQMINLGGRALTGIANADYRVGSPAISLVASTVFGGYSVTSFIDALQQQSMGDLQAEPTVTTLSNHTASILVGDETPIRVVDASAGGGAATGASGPPKATVSFKETGIILEVTPTVTDNGQVVMKIHAERSSVQLASSDVGVSFSKQRGDATLLLNDKETAAIGGLTVTNKSESHTGIPVLMDLPLIGRLFRQTRQLVSKQDLLILVTPEIVQDPGTSH